MNKHSSLWMKKRFNALPTDGRCMFGVLAEKNNTWEGTVSMMSGKGCLSDKGKIVDIGGATDFDIWERQSTCDRISGSQEPSATPPVRSSSPSPLDLFIGIMCRKVRLFHSKDVNYTNTISTKRFTPDKSSFDLDSDTNGCYKAVQDPILPPGNLMSKPFGLSNISEPEISINCQLRKVR